LAAEGVALVPSSQPGCVLDRLEALMHTGARRFAVPARVHHAARPETIARAVAPPAKVSEHLAPRADAAAGVATRADELGAILARAVAERPHGGSGTARLAGATIQRFLGIGKQKKPARPTQAVPAPP